MAFILFFVTFYFLVANSHPLVNHTEFAESDLCSDIANKQHQSGLTVRDCTQAKNGHYYWRIENVLSWYKAKDACRTYPKGDLASVHDFNEKSLINLLAMNNFYGGCWIGLHRKDFTCSEPFVWSDNSEMAYTDFHSGQPDCSGNSEFCTEAVFAITDQAHFTSYDEITFGWNDNVCNVQMKAICKLI